VATLSACGLPGRSYLLESLPLYLWAPRSKALGQFEEP
jgi:hypothetical protein